MRNGRSSRGLFHCMAGRIASGRVCERSDHPEAGQARTGNGMAALMEDFPLHSEAQDRVEPHRTVLGGGTG